MTPTTHQETDVTETETTPESTSELAALTDEVIAQIDGGGWLIEIHDVPYIGDVYLIPWG